MLERKKKECTEFLSFLEQKGISFDEIKRMVKVNEIINGNYFRLTVDYSTDISEILKNSGLDCVCPEAHNRSLNFPQWKMEQQLSGEEKVFVVSESEPLDLKVFEKSVSPMGGEIKFNAKLIPCNCSPKEMAKRIKESGAIPGGLHAVLALQKKYPELQQYLSVLSAGSYVLDGEELITFMLTVQDGYSKLDPAYYEIKEGKRRYVLSLSMN